MSAPMLAPLPPGLELSGDYVLRLTAVDPATGNLVAGVKLNAASIQLVNVSGGPSIQLQAGPYTLVPGPAD